MLATISCVFFADVFLSLLMLTWVNSLLLPQLWHLSSGSAFCYLR